MASFNFSTGRKALTAFSLASLTDIVLLLLIFFLLTSSFVTQNGLRVTLPDVAAAAPLELGVRRHQSELRQSTH